MLGKVNQGLIFAVKVLLFVTHTMCATKACFRYRLKRLSCIADESRSLEVVLQEEASNHLKGALIKSQCGERLRKSHDERSWQVGNKEMNESEPLMRGLGGDKPYPSRRLPKKILI